MKTTILLLLIYFFFLNISVFAQNVPDSPKNTIQIPKYEDKPYANDVDKICLFALDLEKEGKYLQATEVIEQNFKLIYTKPNIFPPKLILDLMPDIYEKANQKEKKQQWLEFKAILIEKSSKKSKDDEELVRNIVENLRNKDSLKNLKIDDLIKKGKNQSIIRFIEKELEEVKSQLGYKLLGEDYPVYKAISQNLERVNTFSLKAPKYPNKTKSRDLKNGKWVFWYPKWETWYVKHDSSLSANTEKYNATYKLLSTGSTPEATMFFHYKIYENFLFHTESILESKDNHYRVVNYQDDKPIGTVIDYYYISGEKRFEGGMKLNSLNKEVYDGKCIWYYENGNKYIETIFQEGKKNGLFLLYQPNGVKDLEVVFDNGVILQPNTLKVYDKDGTENKKMTNSFAEHIFEKEKDALLYGKQSHVENQLDAFRAEIIEKIEGKQNASSIVANKFVPQHPNMIDKNGIKQGWWTIKFDGVFTCYRVINYENGKPKGKVTEYNDTGLIMFEGQFLIDTYLTPYQIKYDVMLFPNSRYQGLLEGKCTWYEIGSNLEPLVATFANGKLVESNANNRKEQLINTSNNDWKKEAPKELSTNKAMQWNNLMNQVGINPMNTEFMNNNSEKTALVDKEPILKQALQIAEEEFGRAHPNYVLTQTKLIELYLLAKDYDKAEALYKEFLIEVERKNGKESLEYAQILLALAFTHYSMGKYDEAVIEYEEFLKIAKKVDIGNTFLIYMHSLYVSELYAKKERNQDAINILEEALIIGEKLKEGKGVFDNVIFSNLEKLYKEQRDVKKSAFYAQKVAKANTKNMDEMNSFDSKIANAELQRELIRLRKDSTLSPPYKKTRQLLLEKKAYNAFMTEDVTTAYKSIPIEVLREYPDSEEEIQKAIDDSVNVGDKMAIYIQQECIKSKQNKIMQLFPFLSEKEKQIFIGSTQNVFDNFNIFSVSKLQEDKNLKTDLLPAMYDSQLATKSLILSSLNQLKKKVASSNDASVRTLYTKWQNQKNTLAKVYQMTEEQRSKEKINLVSLEKEANEVEKTLFKKVGYDNTAQTWKDVQKKLKSNEAAVEMIRVQRSKDTLYVALIVTPATLNHPEMVILENGAELESSAFRRYSRSITSRFADTISYRKYWQPIYKILQKQNVQKIYFSPDRIYHQINLNTLQNPENKKYAGEEIEIQILSNTKDLIGLRNTKSSSFIDLANLGKAKAELFGFPLYSATKAERESIASRYKIEKQNSEFIRGSDTEGSNLFEPLKPLEDTKTEVENIAEMLKEVNIKSKVYLEKEAIEEAVKNQKAPTILHIATHGFFLPANDENGQNPLLRSGLHFAGADETRKNPAQAQENQIEDGILTAYEAVGLDLQGTELVVLSACETGLGEFVNGEGIYGLQRAFIVAGTKCLIMSMWKVNDKATQELMTNFYKNLISGLSKREAFKEAQTKIKNAEGYKHPYYWGAFVMIGE
jgi:CHAT domain-containing protein/antitoxin component YwqK of YwqJK toxin-antitoxin module